MITSDFEATWKELEESHIPDSENGVIIRRISVDIPHDFFLGFEKTISRRMFLVRINKKDYLEFERLPKFRGFEILLMKFSDEKPGNIMVSLCLSDPGYSEIFSVVCEDLLTIAARESDHNLMVKHLINRLLQWKQFLDLNGNQGLSAEAQRGLYGELRFLRDVLIQHLEISIAINSWLGPSRKNQDFQFLKMGVEVKTSIAKQHQKIHVANELQLDDNDLDSLYIYFLSLRESTGHGETLPDIIDDIRKIIELKNGPNYDFENQLFKSGYIDKHRTKYKKTGYHDRNIQIFQVIENFPRIIEPDLKPGVGDVQYTIDLAVCKQFLISKEDFISDLEWMKNDGR